MEYITELLTSALPGATGIRAIIMDDFPGYEVNQNLEA